MTKKELLDIITEGKIKDCLNQFLKILEDSNQDDLHSNIIHLSSRFNRNEGIYRKGTISYSNYNLELNKISSSLKEYINNDYKESENSISHKIKNSNVPHKGVFISYSHSDKEYALKLKESLEKLGCRITIDMENLDAGGDIKSFIDNSIKNNSNTISIISKNSLTSSWVALETIRTLDSENISSKKYIAVMIDNSVLDRNFTDIALDKIESNIHEIESLIQQRIEKGRNINDLNTELGRYKDLQHNLPRIVERIKNSFTIDITDATYDENINKVHEALI